MLGKMTTRSKIKMTSIPQLFGIFLLNIYEFFDATNDLITIYFGEKLTVIFMSKN